MVLGVIIGYLIYLVGKVPKPRIDDAYVGGEDAKAYSFPGTHFYTTIKNMGGFSRVYKAAEKRFLDFYEWGVGILKTVAYFLYYCLDRLADLIVKSVARLALLLSWILREGHIGVLPAYLAWCLIGFGILLFVLVR